MSTDRAIAKNDEGIRLLDSGDYEGAVAAFDEALTLDPSFAAAYRNRSAALRKLGRVQEADADHRMSETIASKRMFSPDVLPHAAAHLVLEKAYDWLDANHPHAVSFPTDQVLRMAGEDGRHELIAALRERGFGSGDFSPSATADALTVLFLRSKGLGLGEAADELFGKKNASRPAGRQRPRSTSLGGAGGDPGGGCIQGCLAGGCLLPVMVVALLVLVVLLGLQ
jgi:tetratricopeptide (TPR) repeat protein